MLTPLHYFDILIMSNSLVGVLNTDVINPLKSKLFDTARTLFRGVFVVGGVSYTLPNNANRVGWLAGKNRLGSVSNFTTKDMAAKAVPDQTAPASEPSRHIVAVATRQNVAWKVCPDIGFNVDSGRSNNRPSELSTSLRRRWC